MVNRFTLKAQNSLNRALSCARELGHTYIGSEHLLLGLLAETDSIAARGDWETADRWYSRAQQLAPERPDLCRRRAEMNRLLGRADIAAEQAERARRLFPLAPRHAHSDSRSPIN